MLTNLLQKNMELLVLENLETAVKKGSLVTQVPEQVSKVKL
jgi:glyoxylate reductase